jgi:hypothetical protein
MNLCSDGHEEVCYEGRNCPACELKYDNKKLLHEISTLETEIASLRDERGEP